MNRMPRAIIQSIMFILSRKTHPVDAPNNILKITTIRRALILLPLVQVPFRIESALPICVQGLIRLLARVHVGLTSKVTMANLFLSNV